MFESQRCWTQPRGGRGDPRSQISDRVKHVMSKIREDHPDHAVDGDSYSDDNVDSDSYACGVDMVSGSTGDITHIDNSGDNVDSDNSDDNVDSDNSDDFNLRDVMDPIAIRNAVSDLPPNDISRQSYEALLNHDCWPKDCDPRWQPFDNIIPFICWLGRGDQKLRFTRNHLQWILNLLLTLQDHQIISSNVWIPSSAVTIEEYDRYFPEPPVCLVIFFFVLFVVTNCLTFLFVFFGICCHSLFSLQTGFVLSVSFFLGVCILFEQ